MSLKDPDVFHVVPMKEFSSGKITNITPVNSRAEVEFPPICAARFMLVSPLQDTWRAFLETFE